MSTYWSVLSAARDLVAALPALVPAEAGGTAARAWRVTLRDAPRWDRLLDGVYGVVVAPREDLAELARMETFGNVFAAGHEVYVGVAVPLDKTEETLRERLLIRETARLELYKPTLLSASVAGQFQVEYDPAPAAAEPAPPGVKITWQKFTYWVKTARASE